MTAKTTTAKTAPNLSKYQSEIDKLVKDIKADENKSKDAIGKVDKTFLTLGDTLVKAQIEAKLSKKDFVTLKNDTATQLGSSGTRNITKVVKVAENAKITELRNANKIPANWGWGTLYLLTGLDDVQFASVVAGIDASSMVTRDELATKIKALKTDDKPASKKRLIIKLADENAVITTEMEATIVELLDGRGFVIV
jgi:hypothetical protein